MSDLFGNHIVGFPTRRLICLITYLSLCFTERRKQKAQGSVLGNPLRNVSCHEETNNVVSMRKPTMWFPNRSDTNQAVQAQKMTRSLKFWIKEEGRLFYPCSENKGPDQLPSYCEIDLHLSFGICKLLVFS